MNILKARDSPSTSWESDLKVIERMRVIIPLRLLLVCNSIAAKLDGEEFSIVTNIKNRSADTIILSEDYYIPKQRVTSVSIDYLPDQYSHSVVIHRHPNGLNSFSKTDQEFINQNFELSLLYTAEDYFVNGIYNLKYEDAIIPIPVKPLIDYGLEEIDIANIEPVYNRTVTPVNCSDKDDYLFSYEELYSEINELTFRIESLENELLQYKMTEPIT